VKKAGKITTQHDESGASGDVIAYVDTTAHDDHDDVLDVGVAASMMEIQRDEITRWSSRETRSRGDAETSDDDRSGTAVYCTPVPKCCVDGKGVQLRVCAVLTLSKCAIRLRC
jgi:hypothetical protein